jgi:hypothetical protein
MYSIHHDRRSSSVLYQLSYLAALERVPNSASSP